MGLINSPKRWFVWENKQTLDPKNSFISNVQQLWRPNNVRYGFDQLIILRKAAGGKWILRAEDRSKWRTLGEVYVQQ